MYAVWPYFACMTVLLLVAATPALRLADAPPSDGHNRLRSLDDLRGFLALAVVFHHGAIYHRYLVDGVWELPPSHFYTILGPIGVSLFFMITGFLFWSRLLRQHGRPGWRRLYIDRVFRIGPLYLTAVVGLLIGVVVEGGAMLHASPGSLTRDIAPWLTLGLLDGPDIAGYAGTSHLVAGVMWTLQCEWAFYFSLPVLALLARHGRSHLPVTATLLGIALLRVALHPVSVHRLWLLPLFLSGIVCASLHREGLLRRLPDTWSSAAVIVLLAVVAVTQDGNTASCTALLGCVFYLVVSGCTVFGLLESRAAVRLGDISYGIYVLQGLALAGVMRPLRDIATGSPLAHWALVLLSPLVLVAAATIAHIAVERPGIKLGKRLAAGLARRGERLATSERSA